MARERKGAPTKLVAYRLPPDLVRQVKVEAAKRDKFPAHVVEERLRESFSRRPTQAHPIEA